MICRFQIEVPDLSLTHVSFKPGWGLSCTINRKHTMRGESSCKLQNRSKLKDTGVRMECQTITVDGVAACSTRRRHDRGGLEAGILRIDNSRRDATLQLERCTGCSTLRDQEGGGGTPTSHAASSWIGHGSRRRGTEGSQFSSSIFVGE